MKKTIITVLATIAVITFAASCKQEAPLQQGRQAIKVQVRLVGIDSVSAARTEDKTLFVNVR